MSEDLLSFKMLVASEVGSERDVLRQCAAKAAFPVDYAEVAGPIDAASVRGSLARDHVDFIFVDAHIPKAERQAICDAALSNQGRPLMIFLGPKDLSAPEVQSDGATADGLLAKPFGVAEAGAMIDACARARLPKQVLVVDDSPTVRTVVRKVLQASRFRLEIAEAENGQAAVEQAGHRHVDLVLLDCNMPGLDGFATLDQLKRASNDLQVVMITGTRDTRLEDRARASGADDFLFKPFYAHDVDVALRRLFGLVTAKAS